MNGMRVHATGGPEVLRYEDAPDLSPGAGEALVRLEAIGVNFIDVYHRTGLYPRPLPFTPGVEGAGVVTGVGPDVPGLTVGDRVAYPGVPGSYAEYAVVPAARVVKVPQGIDARMAAAVMLQGITAHYLVHSTYPLRSGEWALVHAAAGGVGLLLIQMAKRIGAHVIGTVSTEAKADLARAAGAEHVILYTQQDFEGETKRLTESRGVQVVYDSVGKTTFDKSLNVLAPRGYMVLFGQSSGPVPPFDPQMLNTKGSLFLTRPTSAHYIATREELLKRAGDLFAWIQAGRLTVRIERLLPLAQAAEAHRLLESRQTAGKVLLTP
jgi:NADPH2:quinone reductase